jgi:hypothetical protein
MSTHFRALFCFSGSTEQQKLRKKGAGGILPKAILAERLSDWTR